jgi:hypothetical protein
MQTKTFYIGRFSLEVPVEMNLAVRTAALRYVEINEVVTHKEINHEQARAAEWTNFMADVNKLTPPIRSNKVILRMQEYPGIGQWSKGLFYHKEGDAADEATWSLLVDTGVVILWLKGDSTMVDDENSTYRMANNISKIGKNYKVLDMISLKEMQQCNCFYLQHGLINLPYLEQEESYVRFEGHPLSLVLEIKTEMDIGYNRETMGLIDRTRGMLAAAAFETGGSMSKLRLAKREVAGMKGEESILRISEDGEKTIMFTWEFNGKEDSGEYPTTTIEMEAPDGKLDEKIAIWDAVLDSMKPMFVRKK